MSYIKHYDYDLLEEVHFTENYPTHIDWGNYFCNANPVIVEIGCGNGHFLTRRAIDNPGNNYIGIDIKKKRIIRCREKQIKYSLNNISWICNEAGEALQKLFADSTITAIYMTFPDPWPKRRHHKHRLFQINFLNIIHNKISTDGYFAFITDHFEYYESSFKIALNDDRFEVISEDVLSELDLTDSLFGNKWKHEKRKFFSFYIRKKQIQV